MIIKAIDDRKSDLAYLQRLLDQVAGDSRKTARIEREIRNVQSGIRGEREAAYEMKVHWGDSDSWMLIHDLRLEHGGLTAQIDHLIINCWMEFWVCESKRFSEGVAINEHGEFSHFFEGRPHGIPSPIAQNNKHILILQRVLESGAVEMPTRLGFTIKPDLKSLILVSNRARISRPNAKIEGIDRIIKCDQLHDTIVKPLGDRHLLSVAKMVDKNTIHRLARDIAKLHKPFRRSRVPKFAVPPQQAPQRLARQFACHSCGNAVSNGVARYCRDHQAQFGGSIYCMPCQKAFEAAPAL